MPIFIVNSFDDEHLMTYLYNDESYYVFTPYQKNFHLNKTDSPVEDHSKSSNDLFSCIFIDYRVFSSLIDFIFRFKK